MRPLRPILAALVRPFAPQNLGRAPADSDRDDLRSLLGRPEVEVTTAPLLAAHAGRSVLVTGAGGSIGSELCRQIMGLGPKRLVLLDNSEPALFQIDRAMRRDPVAAAVGIVPVLGSVCDTGLVRRVLDEHDVDVILHAAAYKHVPLVEANPIAGLRTNVLGTQVVARAAAAAGVERFVLISSDKAVSPAGVMGATKRLAELVVQDAAVRAQATRFAAVRFGNVLGSSGSVVRIFREQIAAGGPITLTDPRATRYFMTVEEAVRLVLAAGAAANGGEVFVLDMGDPVPVLEIARRLAAARGLSLRDPVTGKGQLDVIVTGLRPGERLHEPTMIPGTEATTIHPAIRSIAVPPEPAEFVAAHLRDLREAVVTGDVAAARAVVARVTASVPPLSGVPVRPSAAPVRSISTG